MHRPAVIVDLFSGPGGLGEGFTSLRMENGERAFRIGVSIEKEPSAHSTLRLRAFLRQFEVFPDAYYEWLNSGSDEPNWSKLFPDEWARAEDEARCMTLGLPETADFLAERIDTIRAQNGGRTVLIGGPPCQAYSLVGRSRNAGIAEYDPAKDHRNFLYDEYVKVLNRLKPAVFVMENVKGMLSASVNGGDIFQAILRDLRAEGYKLVGLASKPGLDFDARPAPTDFILRAEKFGIPQARHRVIIVGIREDIAENLPAEDLPRMLPAQGPASVRQALEGMPPLRSGLSRRDDPDAWKEALESAIGLVEAGLKSLPKGKAPEILKYVREAKAEAQSTAKLGRVGTRRKGESVEMPDHLADWLLDERLDALPQNETRGHMPEDLARYLFVAAWGKACGKSPKSADFPENLAPDHASWLSGKFADRFRVQLEDLPATTVTSHIAKDGHYFIHPDPTQCRSLTVREAARLQTFPDNYVFRGNRTEQFVQVGNAVPPLLANQIAKAILPIMTKADTPSD